MGKNRFCFASPPFSLVPQQALLDFSRAHSVLHCQAFVQEPGRTLLQDMERTSAGLLLGLRRGPGRLALALQRM